MFGQALINGTRVLGYVQKHNVVKYYGVWWISWCTHRLKILNCHFRPLSARFKINDQSAMQSLADSSS